MNVTKQPLVVTHRRSGNLLGTKASLFSPVFIKFSRQTTSTCYILYPIVQWNHWFANLDVPFQSVTNDLLHGQFAMQTYALNQVDVTSEL